MILVANVSNMEKGVKYMLISVWNFNDFLACYTSHASKSKTNIEH
jgi:hypothetical protein